MIGRGGQGALSGRAEAVGQGGMVGAVATSTRSAAGQEPEEKVPQPHFPTL